MKILAIVLIFLRLNSATLVSRTHRFRGNDLIFQRFSFVADGAALFYALCDRDNEEANEKQCSVVREIDAFDVDDSSSGNNETFCGLTLGANDPALVIGRELLTVAFGVDRAILVWLEKSTMDPNESHLRMTIVRMADCRTSEATLSLDGDDESSIIDKLDFVTYVDTYDLVAKNLSICSDVSIDGYCRLTYDADGNRLAGPRAWFTPLYEEIVYVVSVVAAPRSPSADKGYLMVNADPAGYHVYLVRRDGKEVIELGEDPSSDDDYGLTGFTAANELIGICYHDGGNDKFTCWQFEQDGETRAVVDFYHGGRDGDLRATTMHNLPDGGFLLMTVYCPNARCRGNDVDDRYYLTRVDASMRVQGPREIDGIGCDEVASSTWAQFFRKAAGEHCLARLCWNNGDDARLDVHTQCYPEEFFTPPTDF